MKLRSFLTVLALSLALSSGSLALAARDHQSDDHMSGSKSVSMEYGQSAATFTHQETVEGVQAEFQVMTLASMNMNDPQGKTHHVMVKFADASSHKQLANAIGKIKVISPSGREQVESLQNYGGILAANFTFAEKGKYGVICLFKVDGKKGLVKFWYPQ
ncbi:MAG: hypothetical protein LJE89_09450 [Deltaproteobacteria bacterium]|nr:hypothetical protein [Deltaproteobacteria bacterium]